jgi:hypothetical protein
LRAGLWVGALFYAPLEKLSTTKILVGVELTLGAWRMRQNKISFLTFMILFAWLWIVVTLVFAMSGCAGLASVPAVNPVSPDTFYRRDMDTKVDGVRYPGYGVLPLKNEYEFEVSTKHDMDRFSATTCHRQIVEEKVDGTGWFKKKATYKFKFVRQGSIEQTDPCPMELVGSADSNDHSWAFFDFVTPDYNLKGKLECDGWQNTYPGVSVCQAKKGLVQKVSFEKAVRTSFEPGCEIKSDDSKTFIFEMPRARCVFIFCASKTECHRLTTIGYDEAWLRERGK